MTPPSNASRRRSASPREFAKRILVVTEGTRTEPQYVEGLNGYLRSKGATAIVKPVAVGRDPLKVVEKCVDVRDAAARASREKAYDTSVCLVDVDSHASLPAAIALAKRESIVLLITNLKFEVWLRWHIEDKRGALSSNQLDKVVEKHGILAKKVLAPRFPYHGVDQACDIARRADASLGACRIGPDPSSAMPVLVDLMRAV